MRNRNRVWSVVPLFVALFLVGCGDSGSEQDAAEEAEAPASEDTAAVVEEAAEDSGDTVEEAAEEAMEALHIDASSLESFESSLAGLQESLDGEGQSQLASALASLAASAGEGDGGGLADAARSMASGESVEEIVFEEFKDRLDGMTLDDLLALAEEIG